MEESRIDTICKWFPEKEFLTADGFDSAIIGVVDDKIVYSVAQCLQILVEQGLNLNEAAEFFDYNVRGAYMGELTPIWVDDEMFEY